MTRLPVFYPASRLIVAFFLALIVNCFTMSATGQTSDTASLSVAAECVRTLSLPGTANQLLRPSAIYSDHKYGELFVADPGNNRIVIFDRDGVYRFEFSGGDYFSVPENIAVNSEGYIYVLAAHKEGRRIMDFDFDGVYLGRLNIDYSPGGQLAGFTSLAMDSQDRLFALDQSGFRVCSFDARGCLLGSFPILSDLKPELLQEQLFGNIAIKDSLLFVPVSTLGQVNVYSLGGEYVRTIGYRGNKVGELNFPVGVAVTDDSLVLVLDKHRFNVICFTLQGRFLGEFGGMGSRPGWFYHPTLLTLDDRGQVYIGQVFMNKIDLCRIPEFIRARKSTAQQGPAELSYAGNSNPTIINNKIDPTVSEEVKR